MKKREMLWLIWSNEKQEFRKADPTACPACQADALHSRLECTSEPFTPLIHKATRYKLDMAIRAMDRTGMKNPDGYVIPRDFLIPAPESMP